jgi:hypothetical protein
VTKSVRPVSSRWMPELRASPKPFGLGELHPNNFWEYQDQLPCAYRILSDGVGDGLQWSRLRQPPGWRRQLLSQRASSKLFSEIDPDVLGLLVGRPTQRAKKCQGFGKK